MPEGTRGRARIVQKQPGVVFGLAVVAEVMAQCGVEEVDNLVVEGQWREDVPAEVAVSEWSRHGSAGRRAHRAQLPWASLRDRDADRTLRRGGRRNRRPHSRHAQDDAGAAGPGEGGGGGRWRSEPPHGSLRRDPDQGESHRPGGKSRQGRHAPAAPTRICRSRSSAAPSSRSATRSGTGADRLLLDNMDPDELREAVALRDAERRSDGPPLEASGGVSLETVRPLPRRASTTFRSAP